jgi:hypothetical protein
MMADRNSRKNLRLFLLGGGLFMLLCGWSMYGQGNKSVGEVEQWEQVEAVVLQSEIETVSMRNTYSTGPRNITGWKPAITYRYAFDGRTYEGDRFTVGPSSTGDRDTVAAIVASYPVDTRATAFVNPEDPSEAVLARCDQAESLFLVIAGIFVAVVGAAGIAAAALIRNRDNSPNETPAPSQPSPPVMSHRN